jgi:beta-N-acetylhexosaminidase
MKISWLILSAIFFFGTVNGQKKSQFAENKWVDSVFNTLSEQEKIAQLMIVRMSALKNGSPVFYDSAVQAAVTRYNIGGICLFQGGPIQQAQRINGLQAIAKTPLLITIDAEWGLGMRFDSVQALPKQMMLGAVQDTGLMYRYGRIVADQCRRMGIQVNYAPVVDINNNPDNPVINDRSFGENKYRVARMGLQYMRGMQDHGVMACAKHFPGHGDVSVDSHYDLPVINKSRSELDSLELYPFRELFRAGVGSVMIAHLSIPAIDNTPNLATSLSRKNVHDLLRKELGYNGLSFTDALEMQGVAKYFPDGEASAQSLIAGNDLLCLPGDIEGGINQIRKAIRKKKLRWADIDGRVKKVLHAKYKYGLANQVPVDYNQLTEDLNKELPAMRRRVAEEAITLLRNEDNVFPLPAGGDRSVAYIGIGLKQDNQFSQRMRTDYHAHTYYFDYGMDSARADALLALVRKRYDVIIMGFHAYNRAPARNFGISPAAIYLASELNKDQQLITLYFGNPYAARNTAGNKVLLAAYEDDFVTQETAADLLNGKLQAKGKLPVTVSNSLPYGTGLVQYAFLTKTPPANVEMDEIKLQSIDSVCKDAISQKAIPGCAVLVARHGKIVYEKAFGNFSYKDPTPVSTATIYDLASVTKVMATTLSVMKLYDEGRLDINKTLGDYLPWTAGTNKSSLVIKDVLLHEAGLKSFIPFFQETIDPVTGIPLQSIYSDQPGAGYSTRVAENLFIRNDWIDTLYKRILQSELGPRGRYVYSDNDFIFLGKLVETVTGTTLNQYTRSTFYEPLSLSSTGFKPRNHFDKGLIAPTEEEPIFRRQLLQGDVHDPGAAMFGGVAGHAGLFSNVYDLSVLAQLLLNKGTINGITFFKPSTVDFFTAYHSSISRRGLGFDKPEKDNAIRREPYPSASVSPETYGHTGFTGTCIWIDPKYNLTYIFLSNRVSNNGDPNKFSRINVRPTIQELIYKAIKR